MHTARAERLVYSLSEVELACGRRRLISKSSRRAQRKKVDYAIPHRSRLAHDQIGHGPLDRPIVDPAYT